MPGSLLHLPSRPVHTYSIAAYDPDAGQWGVAVQSHYFCVGGVVAWAEPGVGAVATQSMVDISYGPLGLAMMRAGKPADRALAGLLTSDSQPEIRQVAMVDRDGNVAAHTGSMCIPEAGHRTGKHYSVQANLMLKDTVWDAMAEAFEGAKGDLAERMMVALEAAEGEGGDIRGKQSAAILVVGGDMTGSPWASKPFDLRVDDSPAPLPELRRLINVARAYAYGDRASALLEDAALGDARFEQARALFAQAQALQGSMPGNAELVYWYAIDLTRAGRTEEALPFFKQAFAADPQWRDLVPRLPGLRGLPGAEQLIEKIVSV